MQDRDMMWVKVTEIDEKGRVNLSHKDAVKEIEAKKAAGEPIKVNRFCGRAYARPPFIFRGLRPRAPLRWRWASAFGRCRLIRPSPGGGETFLLPNWYHSIRYLSGLRPRTPGYFSLAGKVPKRAHKGGTLSMGSLPCGSLPRDDTKGGACPPLDTPAGAETCPLSNTLSSIRTTVPLPGSRCGFCLREISLKRRKEIFLNSILSSR